MTYYNTGKIRYPSLEYQSEEILKFFPALRIHKDISVFGNSQESEEVGCIFQIYSIFGCMGDFIFIKFGPFNILSGPHAEELIKLSSLRFIGVL